MPKQPTNNNNNNNYNTNKKNNNNHQNTKNKSNKNTQFITSNSKSAYRKSDQKTHNSNNNLKQSQIQAIRKLQNIFREQRKRGIQFNKPRNVQMPVQGTRSSLLNHTHLNHVTTHPAYHNSHAVTKNQPYHRRRHNQFFGGGKFIGDPI